MGELIKILKNIELSMVNTEHIKYNALVSSNTTGGTVGHMGRICQHVPILKTMIGRGTYWECQLCGEVTRRIGC